MVWREVTYGNRGRITTPIKHGIVNDAGHAPAQPDEILEAKLDGVCPRCNGFMELNGDSGWCPLCKFGF